MCATEEDGFQTSRVGNCTHRVVQRDCKTPSPSLAVRTARGGQLLHCGSGLGGRCDGHRICTRRLVAVWICSRRGVILSMFPVVLHCSRVGCRGAMSQARGRVCREEVTSRALRQWLGPQRRCDRKGFPGRQTRRLSRSCHRRACSTMRRS
jgi:hypothetical protein